MTERATVGGTTVALPPDAQEWYDEAPSESRVEECRGWLADNPDGPLTHRISLATMIASGGDLEGEISIDAVAELAGCLPEAVIPTLNMLKLTQRGQVVGDDNPGVIEGDRRRRAVG